MGNKDPVLEDKNCRRNAPFSSLQIQQWPPSQPREQADPPSPQPGDFPRSQATSLLDHLTTPLGRAARQAPISNNSLDANRCPYIQVAPLDIGIAASGNQTDRPIAPLSVLQASSCHGFQNLAVIERTEYRELQRGQSAGFGSIMARLGVWQLGFIAFCWGAASTTPAPAALLSFPGAEGAGQYAVGGRGGDVYQVTNLADAGPGSFRDGIETASGPRTIVFQVSGTIHLQSDLLIEKPYLTVAGQTAAGGGITIADRGVVINGTHDIIMQFIRFRPGDTYSRREASSEPDALWIRNSRDVIIDHVSTSWGTDETLSVTHNSRNVSVQWSFITEALRDTGHNRGDRGYGSLINGGDITFHHNLYAHNRSRNPRPGEAVRLDFVNNVMYNVGGRYGYSGTDDEVSLNYVGNYGVDGPNTSATSLFASHSTETRIFVAGNYRDAIRNRILDGRDVGSGAIGGDYTRVFSRFGLPQVATTDAVQAYIDVLSHAGAALTRDEIDHRIVGSVLNQTGAHIDSQNEVGGWPELAARRPATDTNGDGIPDAWAIAAGLDPREDVSRRFSANGYTYLENYLHSCSKQPQPNLPVERLNITTLWGNGADGYVGEQQSDGSIVSQGAGNAPFLQASWNGNQGDTNEFILLRFDLSQVEPGTLTNARLELTALTDVVGRHPFQVFGLESGAARSDWNEGTIDFANAPGLEYDGMIATRGLLTDELLRLGVLAGENTAAGDTWSFDNPNLTVFLNRVTTYADPSILSATLLLQPVTVRFSPLQFAAKEAFDGAFAPRLHVAAVPALAVPEPSTSLTMALACLALIARMRRPGE